MFALHATHFWKFLTKQKNEDGWCSNGPLPRGRGLEYTAIVSLPPPSVSSPPPLLNRNMACAFDGHSTKSVVFHFAQCIAVGFNNFPTNVSVSALLWFVVSNLCSIICDYLPRTKSLGDSSTTCW